MIKKKTILNLAKDILNKTAYGDMATTRDIIQILRRYGVTAQTINKPRKTIDKK